MAATRSLEVQLDVHGSEGDVGTGPKVAPQKSTAGAEDGAASSGRRFSWPAAADSTEFTGTKTALPGPPKALDEPAPSIKPMRLFTFASRADLALLLLGCTAACAQGVLLPALGVLMGAAVGASAPGTPAMEMFAPVLRNFGIFIASLCVLGAFWQWACLRSAERQCAKMRKAYLEDVLKKDMEWFDVNDAAEVPVRISVQVGDVQDALGPKTGQLMLSCGQLVSGLAFAFTTGSEGWKLTLVVLTVAPLIGIGGLWVARNLKKTSDVKQSGFATAGAIVEEALASMRTIASFGGERLTVERFQEVLGPAKRAGVSTGLSMGAANGLLLGTFSLMYAVAFWFGANFVRGSGADILQVFFCIIIGISSLNEVGDPVLRWSMALSAGAKMFQVLDSEQLIEGKDEGLVGNEAGTIQEVHFKALEFSYPSRLDVQILKGVSLRIARGQKVALVGGSGSGKSTAVQLLLRFYDPTGGKVTVNGEDLRGLSLKWWRRQLGYVGQEPVLFATSVKKNVTNRDSSVPDKKVVEVLRSVQAYDFLMRLPEKLSTSVGIGGSQLSGGQKQRIAIARALLRTPQILILDEATSALDNESERLVQATIDNLRAEQASGLATISIAHRLSTITNSDVIYVFRSGIVEEQGSHAELMASEGGYCHLVRSQEQAAAKQVEEPALEQADPKGHQLWDSQEGVPMAAASAMMGALQLGGAGWNSRNSSMMSSQSSMVESDRGAEAKRAATIGKEKYEIPKMRLLSISRPEWWLFPLALAGCMSAGCALPVMGYTLGNITEAFYVYTGDLLKLEVGKGCLVFVGLFLTTFLGEITRWGLFSYIQESLAARLRCMCISTLIRQEIGFFDDPHSGAQGLAALMERQVKEVAQVTGIGLGNVVTAVCAILAAISLAFLGSWRLSLACLGVFPIVGACVCMTMAAAVPTGSAAAYGHAGAILSEATLNIRTVRSLQCEQQMVDSFWKVIWKAARQNSSWGAAKTGMIYGFSNATVNILYVVGFAYGGWLIDQKIITQARMFQSIFCILFGSVGLSIATVFSPDVMKAKLASYDMFNLLDRKSQVDPVVPEGMHRSLGDRTIAFKGVEFTYPHRLNLPVLRGLSFSVLSGQSVALVGPSGSGKSTAIQLLLRFYDPTCGQVLVGGVPLAQFDVAWWRRQVSLVGQEPVLFNMTLEDNVMYGKPSATRAEVEAAARKANMDYAFNGQFAWEDSVGLKGFRLSGGQKQRCAIARAIIRDPKVLLLDEATSALDSGAEKEVQQALDIAQAGRTSFTIAHRLSTIMNKDVIMVLADGVLAEKGTHKELLDRSGVYAKLWGVSDPNKGQ